MAQPGGVKRAWSRGARGLASRQARDLGVPSLDDVLGVPVGDRLLAEVALNLSGPDVPRAKVLRSGWGRDEGRFRGCADEPWLLRGGRGGRGRRGERELRSCTAPSSPSASGEGKEVQIRPRCTQHVAVLIIISSCVLRSLPARARPCTESAAGKAHVAHHRLLEVADVPGLQVRAGHLRRHERPGAARAAQPHRPHCAVQCG